MRRLALALLLLPLASPWLLVAEPPAAKTHEVKLNGHTFTLPAGFDVELVAGPPLIDRPVVADFDEQGRLYVAEVDGAITKEDVAQKKPMHRILRLEDSDGDGRFDKKTVFADKMTFTEGVMWLDGSLYVGAPPIIWKLTDADGDGVADKREEWFDGKTLTGCANDLHGPYAGPDGWVYWCKGAFAKQTYELPGKQSFVTRAAHIFRCRPDGSGLEPVMTGGMDNPVDVVFTPGGERIFTTTFFQHPAGGKRDGLIHAVYGGIYGKDHDVIYDPSHKWTSPNLMPVLTHMGAAAPCGLTRYESDVFGKEYRDNLFACQFNMHKVSRHVLEPDGATFRCRDEDFLVSSNLDFHPTDVLEDADGSLLVIDTGGWYKLCCPTSQLHKPDVLGAIYRVRKTGAAKVTDPRGRKISWAKAKPDELKELLGDPRPAVRRKAVETLAARAAKDPDVFPALLETVKSGETAEARRNAVWAATRIDEVRGRRIVRTALRDADEDVRQAALHSISVRRDAEAVPALLPMLKGPSLANRRVAAEALGRIGNKTAVPALLEALGHPADRALEHSLTYALIEIGDAEGTGAGLKSDNVLTRRGALIALDQTGGGLKAESVTAELASSNPAMKEAAWWIAGRHPEWAAALVGFLRDRLAAKELKPQEADDLAGQLARLARGQAVQDLLAERVADASATKDARRTVLRAMARSGLKEPPDSWIAGLTTLLRTDDVELTTEALATVRALPIPKPRAEKLTACLLEIAADTSSPPNIRLAALAAVPGGLPEVKPQLFDFLRARLSPDEAVSTRTQAAEVLAKSKLTTDQLITLTESVKTAGPLELDRLLEAFPQSTDERVGRGLVAALQSSTARASLRRETLAPKLAKFGPAVQKQAEELYAAVAADNAKQLSKLEELLTATKDGDVRRGQLVFNSSKAACFTCHAVGYLGGKVGPDLTHIGKIRTERDLLESIVFPSASFVRSYEPVVVTTRAGKSHNGLVKKDGPDEIVLTVAADQEVHIPRDDVDDVQPSKVSVMPAGLDQQLSVREIADLIAFLKACQ